MGPSSPCKSRPVVMVVEDQRLVALDIADELQAFGYEVPPTASSGEDAVVKAREIQPDLILMDIRLEGEMDGITAGRIIRSQMDIPIVYLTAYSDDATLARAKATEPFGYLIKPLDAVELKTTIEMALYKHSAERRLKESERWLTTTLRSIGDGVLATDSSGCLTFMNPVAEALTGWRQAEAAGRSAATVFRAVSGEGSGCTAAGIDQSIQRGSAIELAQDTRLAGRNGREIDISGSICPICDDAGRILGAVVVFRDVSAHKRLLSELKRHRDHLQDLVSERTRELDRKHAELGGMETELRKSLRELDEHHIALKVLIERNEGYRLSLEKALVTNLKTRVGPTIKSLKQSRLNAMQQTLVELIENDVAEITSPFVRNLIENNFPLTFQETQIAVLVKQGKTTKEIAAILKSSPRAIEFHRHILRRKIGVAGKPVSLEARLAEFDLPPPGRTEPAS